MLWYDLRENFKGNAFVKVFPVLSYHIQIICIFESEGLRKIFGLGAEVIEKAVVRSLYHKLGIKYEEKKNYGFLAYLKDAMQITKDEDWIITEDKR
jgi:hypothetical protein